MENRSSVQYVIGPDGEKMTRADLPAPAVRRWVPRRKARVVAAVEGGLISREEACSRYAISDEKSLKEAGAKLAALHEQDSAAIDKVLAR